MNRARDSALDNYPHLHPLPYEGTEIGHWFEFQG